MVSMNQITTYDSIAVILYLCDEKCSGDHLAPHGELHRCDALRTHGSISSDARDHPIHLDQLGICLPKLLEGGISIMFTMIPPSTNM
jgi:hypothetical protein